MTYTKKRPHQAVALLVGAFLIAGTGASLAGPGYQYKPVETFFTPVVLDPESPPPATGVAPVRPMLPVHEGAALVPGRPGSDLSRPQVQKTATVRSTPILPTSGSSIRGKASWFCNYDDPRFSRSVCHYRYPDGPRQDLYAAACGKLRRAMGGEASRHWRGKTVTVTHNSISIRVKLVDWCGSEDKTIDLYRDAMDAIRGGGGVARVIVSW